MTFGRSRFSPVSSANKTDRHDITEMIYESGAKHHKPNHRCFLLNLYKMLYGCQSCKGRGKNFCIYCQYDLVQRFVVRGDFSVCWYWCNCWPSLFKLSFVLLILVELLTITVLTFFCFVDIGGIVDHHCLNCLLCCWYWWNCWPSLF